MISLARESARNEITMGRDGLLPEFDMSDLGRILHFLNGGIAFLVGPPYSRKIQSVELNARYPCPRRREHELLN